MNPIPEPPAQLKAIQGYIKISNDIEKRDPIVSYWIRLYSTETALRIDKDSQECKKFLCDLLIWLEKFKQSHKDDERVTNQTVGQAHFENYVMSIFNMADTMDRNGDPNTKRTVAMFFMAIMLFETMSVFGALSDELQQRAKYAKFKAAYIQKCIKTGQTPKPGPIDNTDLDGGEQTNQPPALAPSPMQQNFSSEPGPPSSSQDFTFISNPSPNPPPSTTWPSTGGNQGSPLVLPETPDKDKIGSGTTNDNSRRPVGYQFVTSPTNPKPTISGTKYQAINGAPLAVNDMLMSQKYCKFATSALQYDDIKTAVANLEKALSLLKTGEKID